MTTPIGTIDILKLVQRYVNLNHPLVCRHLVACDLLSLLESHGVSITQELARSVVNGDDEAANSELRKVYL